MSLFIKDFSEISDLSPQTLRFYHSEGLLVPAEVDEATGYRYYEMDQVETALLVSALREAGLSVRDVRRALDEPDSAADLLRAHAETQRRRRAAEDEAMATARDLLASWPEVEHKKVPGETVLSAFAPAVPVERRPGQPDRYDWTEVAVVAEATAGELRALAREHGAAVAGTPWFTMALETPEQKERFSDPEGPHWLVKLPVVADAEVRAALAEKVDVQEFAAREEVSVRMPGRHTAAKYSMAGVQLVAHQPPEGYFAALGETRHLLHAEGIETAMPLRPVGEVEDDDDEGGEDEA
ncbi:DNA-binding transcriptional regulator, MerR family [Nocardiopsis flavescens]|uniref:DNA-binding transcriptional regulator, MerR family n=1 Tax=Nocardiopsis flavescens TaxID=758803 RepID=A0A1M6ATH1_9ACTN|nr:MerR family transcriptional regulator [Nocardiopsis flavescens]SHI39513.1 DNA-binding transcriptional regulator, MerR family [Nocardiopsis flavescens]